MGHGVTSADVPIFKMGRGVVQCPMRPKESYAIEGEVDGPVWKGNDCAYRCAPL